MENKNIYIIVRESVSRGFNGMLISPWFYEAFSDAAERMKKMLSGEKERFSDEAEVSFSGDDQCVISEGPAHSVTLRIEKIEKYGKEQHSDRYNAVDLGLPSGLKWSDRNVGAASPEVYGGFFMWGSVTPDTDKPCDWAHAPFNDGSSSFDRTYFNAHKYEWLDGDVLNPEYDAAHVIMGGSWRMPTFVEIQELLAGTTRSVETLNGVKGMYFTSKVNGNSIFMPLTGYRYDSDIYGVGNYGCAWSSSLYAGTFSDSHYLCFDHNGNIYANSNYGLRYFGFIVRGVCE